MLRDAFIAKYKKDYPKAVEKLLSDQGRMVTFYSYSKEQWVHTPWLLEDVYAGKQFVDGRMIMAINGSERGLPKCCLHTY